MSTSVGEEKELFFIKVLKPHLSRRVLKTFERKLERESLKETISTTNGRYASEEAES